MPLRSFVECLAGKAPEAALPRLEGAGPTEDVGGPQEVNIGIAGLDESRPVVVVVPSANEPELLRELLAAMPEDAPFTLLVLSAEVAGSAVPVEPFPEPPQGVRLLRLSPEEAVARLVDDREATVPEAPSMGGRQEAAHRAAVEEFDPAPLPKVPNLPPDVQQ